MKKSINELCVSDARFIHKWLIGNEVNLTNAEVLTATRNWLRNNKTSPLDAIIRIDKECASMPKQKSF